MEERTLEKALSVRKGGLSWRGKDWEFKAGYSRSNGSKGWHV
jgi:hypothetical protein